MSADDAAKGTDSASSQRPIRPLQVMISSRCRDPFDGDTALSVHRATLLAGLESVGLFGERLFGVWISEVATAGAGQTWWDACVQQARDADLVIVLYNGCSGREIMKRSGIGICHAEFAAAMQTGPDKVRVIDLLPPTLKTPEDEYFQQDLERYRLFRQRVSTAAELNTAVRQAVLDGLEQLAALGSREARRGAAYLGPPLEWNRLDFASRRAAMRAIVAESLSTTPVPPNTYAVQTEIDGQPVWAVCDAVPGAMTVPAARELVGQPFLRDHDLVPRLGADGAGPVHFIACHRGVTEAQAMRQLGFPDAIVVSPPFGVYVADEIQKIQMIFLADCRDATTTRARVSDARAWLERSQEAPDLRRRAAERAQIVRAIWNVRRTPAVIAAVPATPASTPSPTVARRPAAKTPARGRRAP